jgi:gliding motility-associated-like protein
MKRFAKLGLLLICLSIFNNKISGQTGCDFNINAVVTQHSEPCARDGIITVTLTGSNMGNIEVSDAQYGIESVVFGGNSIPQTANGGVIKQVPPGSYIVKVTAMCKIGNKYISKSSSDIITVTGSYVPPNPVGVLFDDIIKPYKCDNSGVIPVKVSGGIPPYKLTVTSDEFEKTFDIPTETNSFPLTGLPAGTYKLSLKDNCGYFPTTIPLALDAKKEKFEVGTPTSTIKCKADGKIPVTISEGKPPFTISVTSTDGYSSDIVVNSTGTVVIDELNEGAYTIVVKDDCEESATFNRTVGVISGNASIKKSSSSIICGKASGEIEIGLTTNLAPYNISVTSTSTPPFEGDFIATKDTVFKELKPGDYTFTITDVCGEVYILNRTVDGEDFEIAPNIVTAEVDGYDGKGDVTIHVTGAIPFIIDNIDFTPAGNSCSNTYSLPMTVNSSDITLKDMCAGEYKITVIDECGNSDVATFSVTPKPINIKPSFPPNINGNGVSGEWSFSCAPSGKVLIELDGGSGHYKLYYTEHPTDASATPDTPVFIDEVDKPDNSYTLTDLPPGHYSIKVEDVEAPSTSKSFNFDIKAISVSIEDVFEKFVHASLTADNDCNSLRARFNSTAYNTLSMFINGGLFNVTFKIIGTPPDETLPVALTVTDRYVTFDLPGAHTYKSMRDNIDSIEVTITPNVDNNGICATMIDTLYFAKVESTTSKDSPSCDGFTISTSQYTDTRGVLCYPYTREVYDDNNVLIISDITDGISVNTREKTPVATGVPFGKYTVVFTDKEGYQWEETVEYTDWKSNFQLNNLQVKDKTCTEYNLTFDVKNICYPYEWELLDKDKVSIKTGTVNDKDETPLIESLEYNTVYSIVVTLPITKEQKTLSVPELDNKKALLNYQISQHNHHCLPDTAKGYIEISRNGNALFGKGTIFEFISTDPELTVPTHLIYEATGSEKVFYPFSSNSENPENVKLKEGLYEFKITDNCEFSDVIKINYETYKLLNFDYEIEYDCNSALLKPSATVVLGDVPQKVYFRLIEYPAGTLSTSLVSVAAGNSIQLTVSGHYKFQVSIEDKSTSCPMDTLVFDYNVDYSKVMFDKLDAYICDSEKGYIEFLVKGGIGDIFYTLIEPGVGTIKEETLSQGTPFTYTEAKQYVEYEIEFRDVQCSGAGGTEKVPVTNLIQDRLIFGPKDLCLGEPINLYSDAPAESYLWTFPNGIGTSTDTNPVINNATPLHSGIYTLEVTNVKGCWGSISKNIDINVVQTPPPTVDAVIYHCISNSTGTVNVEALPGHKLIWFDKNQILLPEAPTYSKAEVDTFDYFVSQINTALYCESEKAPVQVIIEDFPDPEVSAYVDDICKNETPLVVIPKEYIFPDYIYRIYSGVSGDMTGEGTGGSETLEIQSSESMETSGFVYVEVESNHKCVSTSRSEVPVTVIHPAPPVVYDTLYCLDETNVVPLRADFTVGNRLQWYDTDAVTALPSAPVPPTDVAGEFSYWVAQVDILLGCVGDKAELKVTISDLPDTQINASAPEICRRTSPTVIIEDTYNLYTYTLFDKDGNTLDSKISAGAPVNLNSPDYILHQNETMYVEIQNQHKCTSRDRAAIPVSVVIPNVPQVFDTLYCLNAVAAPIRAIPDAGYYIQWYALDGNPAATAPVPPTNSVDTLYYNVTQKHEILHCESDTVQIQVIIDALPDTVKASSPPICPGQYPVIKIPETKSDHTYNVYSETGTFLASQEGSGDSINITLPYPIEESENYFVETMNPNNCASVNKTKTRTEVINYMYLLPEKIPQYQRGRLYSFQLESNAVAPYEYSTNDMLPSGFTLSIEGLISGMAARNGVIDPVPFHVTVVDVNGCYAGRDYVLESSIFIPQAFTPNGDGKNDVFMKGRRLVIFDRLGLKIFEGDDGWDGRRFDGTPAPPDTYFYLIYYEDENLMTQGRKEGYITLIRRR